MTIDDGSADGDLEPLASTSKSPGELLREERIRRRLSVQQAAEELHLDVPIIEAIEADDFQVLGAPVYAKGHLRKYAMLLDLAPDVVIARYQSLGDVPDVPTPIPSSATAPRPRNRISLKVPAPVILLLLVLLLGVLGLWVMDWWASRTPKTLPEVSTAAENARPAEGGEAPVAAPATRLPAAKAPAGLPVFVTMRLQFESESWAEVYDAEGRRLMFDMGRPGQVRTLAGVPPLDVLLGAAAAVDVQVNDARITVPRQPGKNSTRFVVEANGTVH